MAGRKEVDSAFSEFNGHITILYGLFCELPPGLRALPREVTEFGNLSLPNLLSSSTPGDPTKGIFKFGDPLLLLGLLLDLKS